MRLFTLLNFKLAGKLGCVIRGFQAGFVTTSANQSHFSAIMNGECQIEGDSSGGVSKRTIPRVSSPSVANRVSGIFHDTISADMEKAEESRRIQRVFTLRILEAGLEKLKFS